MSLLKLIEDKGAVLEWSPVTKYANLVALGTKDSTGSGFDDHGGELELHMLDFSNKSTESKLLGKARAHSRFSSISWSQMAINSVEYPYGLIAGGMVDGNIHIWNPAKLVGDEPDALLASVEQHQGAVNGLHFNPHKESSHLLASGGSDTEVFVTSIEYPDQPSVFIPAPPPNNAKHTADITKVAWNSQVAHILASSALNGSCYVWDLRQKKAWCELRDPTGGCVSDLAWNPDQGLHIVTSSGDDKNPVLKLWDLRSSTSLPLATLQGHKEGILSVSWCPTDASLLLSCAKDNRTILWDLFHMQPVYDLPSISANDESSSNEPLFGGLATSAGQRRYHVSWSPCLPAVASASSFDRKVQFFSMVGAKSRIGRAPKWLRRSVGATFGFGGKLISFDNKNHPVTTTAAAGSVPTKKNTGGSMQLKIHQIVEDPELVLASDRFHEIIGKGLYKDFCDMKSTSTEISAEEREIWSLMNVICFGSNAREELLTHLGFDSATISATAQEYVNKLSSSNAETNENIEVTAEDTFSSVKNNNAIDTMSIVNDELPTLPEDVKKTAELWKFLKKGHAAEPTIRRAIIVGNFEAAVECCLEAGLMAEALLLAQCGDSALRIRTQATFFEKSRNNHPFLNVLHAVIKNELMNFVVSSNLTCWKETLALLSTYGKSNEFPSLCEALASRLEAEINDTSSATLCYMCAANVSRTVEFWTSQLNHANESLGYLDTNALQNYVEKIVVFTQANPVDTLSQECSNYFAKYAELLANQGRLNIALSYLKGQNLNENILIDRLYHAGEKKVAGSRPPPFPFTKIQIEANIVKAAAAITTSSQPQVQQYQPQQQQPQQQQQQHYQPQQIQQQQPQQISPSPKGGSTATVKPRSISSNSAALAAATAALSASNISNNASAVAPVQHVQPQSTAYVLPPGWIQLVDPTSNHPYYVNQATGQSQWEAPAPLPVAPTPVQTSPAVIQQPQPVPIQHQQQQLQVQQQQFQQPLVQQSQPVMTNAKNSFQETTTPTPQTMIPSPQVTNTYNPTHPTPATAASSFPATNPAASHTTASSVGSSINASSSDNKHVQYLGTIIANLNSVITAPAEKKQMQMVTASYEILLKMIQNNEVSTEVMQKIVTLVEYLEKKNFAGANQVQTDLANTYWAQHKEWIKGMKILNQLASKK